MEGNRFFSKKNKFVDLIGRADKRQKLMAAIAAITGMNLAAVLGAMTVYDSFFPRYERPDYSMYPGVYCFDRVDEGISRETLKYPSNGVELQGYYYEADFPRGLVVLVHGLHAGADDYLPIIVYLVKNNISVFAYDGRGTYDSEGRSTVGFCQSLVDLDNTLAFVSSSQKFRGLPLFLLGHSCGGYAVTSALALGYDISACAAIAPVNNCYTLITDKGEQYVGALATEGLPKVFLDAYQKELFGKYTELSGVKGINSVSVPVLIAHGTDDKIISFGGQSIIARRDEITNPNVSYYVRSGLLGGHDSIWHSERSAVYREKVSKDLAALKKERGKELTEDDIRAFYKTVDNDLYSEVNFELMDGIVRLFLQSVNK